MAIDRIHDYIVPGKRAHLVGIGGVSMSPLAEVLHGEGLIITGSDMKDSDQGPGHPGVRAGPGLGLHHAPV